MLKSNGRDYRKKRVEVRLTPEEYDELVDMAYVMNRTLSDVLREAIDVMKGHVNVRYTPSRTVKRSRET